MARNQKSLDELSIFNNVRKMFELIHQEVHSNIPKIDRMSTGIKALSDVNEIVKTIRKIYEAEDKSIKKNHLLNVISLLYDVDSTCILWRESKIISIKHHAAIAEEIASALAQSKSWLKYLGK